MEKIDLPQGTLDLLVLRILAAGEMHGWGHCPAAERPIQGGAATAGGHTLSGALSDGGERLDRRGVGPVREQPKSEILSPDEDWPKTTRCGKGGLGSTDRCCRPSHA